MYHSFMCLKTEKIILFTRDELVCVGPRPTKVVHDPILSYSVPVRPKYRDPSLGSLPGPGFVRESFTDKLLTNSLQGSVGPPGDERKY